MKRLLTILLAATLILGVFTGCKEDSGKLKIGIIQPIEHTSLDTIRESFIEELANLGYKDGENVIIDYKNGQNDQSNLKAISQKFVGDNYDLIVAIATPAAQAVVGETKDIPIVFSACTDPVSSGFVENMEKPGGNVTGTSDYIAVDKIFELAKRLTPDVKTFGLMYNTGETNSVSVINDAKAYLTANGLKYVEATVTNTSEVQQAALSLNGRAEAIFIPIDNTVASAMATIAAAAIESKLPIYTGADSMVQDGGFATVGIDYTTLGRETANMAAQILAGTKPGDIPVKIFDEVGTYINKTTAEKIDIELSESILNSATKIFE